MGDPQVENGYTKIANELLEAVCKIRISGEARQIFDVIIRLTYGFNKKSAQISLGRFSELTLLTRQNCNRGIKKLIDMNLITKNNGEFIACYSINKYYNTWGSSVVENDYNNKNECSQKRLQSITKMTTVVVENDYKSVVENDYHKRKKENYKENIKERESLFTNELSVYSSDYPKEMLDDFFRYWSEPNKSKTKMKWEMQSTWDLSRRLKTWEKNNAKWSRVGKDKELTEDQRKQINKAKESYFED